MQTQEGHHQQSNIDVSHICNVGSFILAWHNSRRNHRSR